MTYDELLEYWAGHFVNLPMRKLQEEMAKLQETRIWQHGFVNMNKGQQAAYEACLTEYKVRLTGELNDIRDIARNLYLSA